MSEKLYTDRDYFDRMFGSIDRKIEEVNKKLDKLNGTMDEHTKVISENLPHDISHCVQTETIEKLKENMVSEKAVKKTIYIGIAILGTLITIIWGINELFFK